MDLRLNLEKLRAALRRLRPERDFEILRRQAPKESQATTRRLPRLG